MGQLSVIWDVIFNSNLSFRRLFTVLHATDGASCTDPSANAPSSAAPCHDVTTVTIATTAAGTALGQAAMVNYVGRMEDTLPTKTQHTVTLRAGGLFTFHTKLNHYILLPV